MDVSEAELLERCKSGDLEAFESIIVKYENKIYSVAYRFMGNPSDASDLAQEAFIRIYQGINKFRGESSFLTWAYHIVANLCRDELRRRQRGRIVSFEKNPDIEHDFSPDKITPGTLPDPVEAVVTKERNEHIQYLISKLPDEYRTVLVMREFQDFSYEEMAEQLNCSLGTIKSRLNRARKALRDMVIANEKMFREVPQVR